MQCECCELFYIDPYPQQSDETFQTVAQYSYRDLEIVQADRHFRSSCLYYETYLPYLEPELADAGRVLDVGCGTGRLLQLLGERPATEATGLELNAQRAEFARQVSNCPVHQVPLEAFQGSDQFDVIFMMNVLSHVPAIDPFFVAARRLLRPGGKLVLKVGEMSEGVRRSAVNDWSLPDHLHFLGLKTIDVIARKHAMTKSRHERWPLSWELFAPNTWRAPGRSRFRNALKQAVVHTPFALPLLKRAYDWRHGQTIFTSLVVLQKPERESD